MVEFYDRARIDLLSSVEYTQADKAKRGKMLKMYDEASPEERQVLVYGDAETEGLTIRPRKPALEMVFDAVGALPDVVTAAPKVGAQFAKDSGLTAMGVDILGQAGGAFIGSKLPIPGATGALTTAGAIGADRLNRAIGLRDPYKVDIPFAGPMENERLVGPVTTGDLVAASGPLIGAGINKIGRSLVKPVINAIDKADEVNTAARTKYAEGLEQINREFKEDMAKIAGDRAMKGNERVAALHARQQAYQDRLNAHTQAYQEAPSKDFGGFPKVGGHDEFYDDAARYGQRAGSGAVSHFKKTADELSVKLGQPADPLQSKFKRLTDTLSEFGDATTDEAPVERMIATHKSLGKLIGRLRNTDGEELRAAQKLYVSLDDDLQAIAAKNPTARLAIEAQKEASLRFKRLKIQEEWQQIFKDNSTPVSKTEVKLNMDGVRRDFRDFIEENPFVKTGLSAEEKTILADTVEELPKFRVGSPPTDTLTPQGTGALDDRVFQHQRQLARHGQPPTPVEPEIESFPIGKAVLTKVVGSELIGRLQGLGGPNPSAGIVAALGLVGLPSVVSLQLIKTPGGRQLAQDIASRKIQLTPGVRLAISEAIRQGTEE